jgi:xeroderma pigmentosum group C-complementing protein
VVQAFHLPKNTHVTLSHTPSPAREIPKLADELEEPATSDAPAGFLASDFVMMDADSDIEAVVGLQPEQGYGHDYVPKTMQEMAEEHAARWQQLDSDADDDIDEVNDGEKETALPQVPLAVRPTRKSKKPTTVKITLSSEASTPNNLSRSRSTKAKTNKKSLTTPNLKRKRRSSRKKVEEESDSADLTVTSEEDQEDEQPSPSKRTRGRVAATKANRTPVAIAPSTRTLRPRISKTTAQIEEEKQNGDDR